ncbi:hypothetical protein BB558_006368 [Smittium angustum]|nr:hypothetical protein BB558_006368 [Smittium angustum]
MTNLNFFGETGLYQNATTEASTTSIQSSLYESIGTDGSFLSSLLALANKKSENTLIVFDENTPKNGLVASVFSLFFCELVGTCLLTIGIFAITDIKNSSSRKVAPITIGLLYFGCKLVFGLASHGGTFNPALDASSRLLGALFFSKLKIPGLFQPIYMISTIIGPFIGGILGASFYEALTWSNEEHRVKVGEK